MRKGRFDEIFFVDLPSPKEREEIFRIHINKKRRDAGSVDLNALVAASQQFVGAEIEQAVISALFDAYEDGKADLTTERLLKSVEEIVPLAYTMKEMIDGMREWAKSRARRASTVDAEGKEEGGGGRKLEI
jgi:SpoVK/Ycf46/Vps4 family AAA+-type ATPase